MLGFIYLIVGLVLAGIYCLSFLPFSDCDKSMIICESFLIGMFWPISLTALIVAIWKFRK